MSDVATQEDNTIYLSANGAKLLGTNHTEVLWEGGVGTGKTFQLCIFLVVLCRIFPGIRILLVRQTRISLNDSVLETLEEEVLGQGHPACTPERNRANRPAYVWPDARTVVDGIEYKGRSRMVLGGMDKPERFMSTQFDVIAFVEATEGHSKAWGQLSTRTRRYHITRFGKPWSLQIADCNPAGARHWLNLRADEPVEIKDESVLKRLGITAEQARETNAMHRIKTHIKDNPKFWDAEAEDWTDQGAAYMVTLYKLPPDQRKALLDGLWTNQTGQVYSIFKHEKHVVNGRLVERKDDYRKWWLEPAGKPIFGVQPLLEPDFEARPVSYFVIGNDWGYEPDPGVCHLYAIDEHGRAFMVMEWYQTNVLMDDWCKRIIELQRKYDVRAIVTDGPQERVDTLNQMLGGKLNDRGEPIAIKGEKKPGSILAGIDIVRFAMGDDATGEPKLRFFSGALQNSASDYLLKHHAPTDTLKEFDGYVYHERNDDKPNKPLPLDKDNHGMDAMRYVMMHLFGNSYRSGLEPPTDPREKSPLFVKPDQAAEARIALEAAGVAPVRGKRRNRRR